MYKTRTQQRLVTRVPGTARLARSFGELRLNEESVGNPDGFLLSAIVLDPPGQR